jgi:hypothetical protein
MQEIDALDDEYSDYDSNGLQKQAPAFALGRCATDGPFSAWWAAGAGPTTLTASVLCAPYGGRSEGGPAVGASQDSPSIGLTIWFSYFTL